MKTVKKRKLLLMLFHTIFCIFFIHSAVDLRWVHALLIHPNVNWRFEWFAEISFGFMDSNVIFYMESYQLPIIALQCTVQYARYFAEICRKLLSVSFATYEIFADFPVDSFWSKNPNVIKCQVCAVLKTFDFLFCFDAFPKFQFWDFFFLAMTMCSDCALDVCLKSAQTETWAFHSKNFSSWGKRKNSPVLLRAENFLFSKVMKHSTIHKYRLDSINIFLSIIFYFTLRNVEYLIAHRITIVAKWTNETYFI